MLTIGVYQFKENQNKNCKLEIDIDINIIDLLIDIKGN